MSSLYFKDTDGMHLVIFNEDILMTACGHHIKKYDTDRVITKRQMISCKNCASVVNQCRGQVVDKNALYGVHEISHKLGLLIKTA